MRCKRCGGTIDTKLGECVRCGMRLPEEHRPFIRSMEEIASEYMISDSAENSTLPELFREYADKKTELAQALEKNVENEQSYAVKGDPVFGLDEYAHLLGVDNADDIAAAEKTENSKAPAPKAEQSGEIIHPFLQRLDRIIEKPANKLLAVIHERFPQPSRAKRSSASERLMLLGGIFAASVALLLIAVVIINSIAPDISGEWLISETAAGERFTVEFTKSGEVTARVYIDGEENVYITGEYKVRRSNGNNLLTISYDDGSEKLLYYYIEHDTGTFTNIESNKNDVYTRID